MNMKTNFLYKFRIKIEDDSNLLPHIWTFNVHISADNKENAEVLLLRFYENVTILEYELIEVIKYYEKE